jgi:hypothetical protein
LVVLILLEATMPRAQSHLASGLRWALYEVAQVVRRGERTPDREYYLAAKEEIGVMRVPAGCAQAAEPRYPALRELGEEEAPVASDYRSDLQLPAPTKT